MITIATTALLAFVAAEIAVYSWHRWISHAGLLRWFADDVCRRRHFHHHFEQYPPQRLRADAYVPSWDVTFGGAELLLVLGVTILTLKDAIRPALTLAAVSGITLHAVLAVALHSLCHASEEVVLRWRPHHLSTPFRVLAWLRRYHDAHHVGYGNYSLVTPIMDIVGRSTAQHLADPAHIEDELFPDFRRESNSQGKPPRQ